MSFIRNIRKRGLKDLLNPRKWRIFARYLRLKAWRQEYSELKTPEYLDQIVYRMSQPGCKPCLEAGECVHCGCKSPELFFDRTNECSAMHWGPMIDKKQWAEYKANSGIVIDPDYKEQVKKHGKIVKWQKLPKATVY